MAGQGFSILLEAIDHPEDYETDEQILEDAVALLNGRWGLDGTVITDEEGKKWGWVYCTRFQVGTDTIRRALGELTPDYIRFHRGAATQTSQQAIKLVKLKRRWRVPDGSEETQSGEVSGSTSGQGQLVWKRQRF